MPFAFGMSSESQSKYNVDDTVSNALHLLINRSMHLSKPCASFGIESGSMSSSFHGIVFSWAKISKQGRQVDPSIP